MNQSAKDLHEKAAELREASKSVEALEYHSLALVQAAKENDPTRLAEVLADRSIVYRHLASKHDSKLFLLLAKGDLENAVEIATPLASQGATALPIHALGRVMQEIGDLERAISLYKQALTLFETTPPSSHNRPGVIADMKVDLATTEYMNGDKEARGRAEAAIEELKSSGEDNVSTHNYNVWLTGAYMRMAYILNSDDPTATKEYLGMARNIIEANKDDLSIRGHQLDKLESDLAS